MAVATSFELDLRAWFSYIRKFIHVWYEFQSDNQVNSANEKNAYDR